MYIGLTISESIGLSIFHFLLILSFIFLFSFSAQDEPRQLSSQDALRLFSGGITATSDAIDAAAADLFMMQTQTEPTATDAQPPPTSLSQASWPRLCRVTAGQLFEEASAVLPVIIPL